MAGIKRKDAPKAVAAQPSVLKKKQKLAGAGSTHKKSTRVAKVAAKSETSSDDDDEDMLDDDEDMGSDGGHVSMGDDSDSEDGGVNFNADRKAAIKRQASGEDGENKIKSTSPPR